MLKMFFRYLCFFCTLSFIYEPATGQSFKYYYGNLHAHTGFSDGNKDQQKTGVKDPTGSFTFAKKSKNFNFLGISEHNHSKAGMHLPSYAKGITQADQKNSDGNFVCMYGMEFGIISKGGHVLVYGVDKLVGWEQNNFDIECDKSDYSCLWDVINDQPDAFATLAHPERTDFGNLINSPYNKDADKAVCGVAINSGPYDTKDTTYSESPAKNRLTYFRDMLALGYHVGPTIDHDNHNLTFGRMASSRTVILARALERDSIVAAYREMRFYASHDWNVKVNFMVNGFPMGARVDTRKNSIPLSVEVTDPDPGDDVKSIKIFFGVPGSKKQSTVLSGASNTNQNKLTASHPLKQGQSFYYYAEIIQKDGDKVYTAPVWIRRL